MKVPCKMSVVAVQNWECHLVSAKTGLSSQQVTGNELQVVGVWGSGYWVLCWLGSGFSGSGCSGGNSGVLVSKLWI